MNKKSFSKLSRGDIVKHIGDTKTFIVTSNYGKRVTATTTVDMTNPNEWELVLKAKYDKSFITSNILDNIKDLEPIFSKTVDKNFWDLI